MGKLRDRMAEDLKLRGLRLQTIEKYLCTARSFVAFYRLPPTELGAEHVRRYLLHLTEERKLKAGTINTYLGGIRFLYMVTLDRPEVVAGFKFPRQRHPLPDILSASEVEALLGSIESLRHRAVIMAAYGAGLRVSEALNGFKSRWGHHFSPTISALSSAITNCIKLQYLAG